MCLRDLRQIFAHNVLFSLYEWTQLHMIGIKSLLTLGTSGSSSASCLWQTTGHLQGLKHCCPFFSVNVTHTAGAVKTAVRREEANALYAHSGLGFCLYAMIDVCFCFDVVKKGGFGDKWHILWNLFYWVYVCFLIDFFFFVILHLFYNKESKFKCFKYSLVLMNCLSRRTFCLHVLKKTKTVWKPLFSPQLLSVAPAAISLHDG